MNADTLKPDDFIKRFKELFPALNSPWHIPAMLETILREKITSLGNDYIVKGDQALHTTATVEAGAVLKGCIIAGPGSFIGAHAYLRGGVFLDEKSVIGPGCEVKSSMIFKGSALAHFNFVGDSLVGSDVNMEAGSLIANHFNERTDKTIYIRLQGKRVPLDVIKFGAIVGDHSRIGANAVLSPGTILAPSTIVKRLELIEQA